MPRYTYNDELLEYYERFKKALDGRSLRKWAAKNELDFNRLQVQVYQKKMPNPFDVVKYAKGLGVSVEWLINGEEPTETEQKLERLSADPERLEIALGLLEADDLTLEMHRRISAGQCPQCPDTVTLPPESAEN